MSMSRRMALVLAAASLVMVGPVAAQPYPSKTIRFVLPFATGGATDIYARLLAGAMAPLIGQPIVVENEPGGAGRIAAGNVARAPKDGYTLLVVTSTTISATPNLYKNLPYKQSDFTPVAMLGSFPFSVFIHAGIPANNWQEFVAYVKANPGKVSYATTGRGSTPHLAGEMLKAGTGLDMLDVPYKGAGPAINDLLAGHVHVYLDGPTPALGHVRAGKLKVLGTLSERRMSVAPEVPTMAELGYPGLVANIRFSVLAPAGTSADVVGLLNKAAIKSMESGPLRERLAADGAVPSPVTPAQLAELLKADNDAWGGVIRKLGIQLD